MDLTELTDRMETIRAAKNNRNPRLTVRVRGGEVLHSVCVQSNNDADSVTFVGTNGDQHTIGLNTITSIK